MGVPGWCRMTRPREVVAAGKLSSACQPGTNLCAPLLRAPLLVAILLRGDGVAANGDRRTGGGAAMGEEPMGERVELPLPGAISRDLNDREATLAAGASDSLSSLTTLLARANFCPKAGTAAPQTSAKRMPPIAQTVRFRAAEYIRNLLKCPNPQRPRCRYFVGSQAIGIGRVKTFVKVYEIRKLVTALAF